MGRRKIVEVFGNDFETPDGSGVRDFIHVSDIANAHILAMNKIEEYPNQEFNLGNGKGFSVFELIRKTEELVNKGILYKIAARRAGDPAVLVASYKKANQILGWSPKNTIDDIILSAYNWRNNPKY